MLLANIDELRACDIFTDGSCCRHSTQAARVFGDSSTSTSGAIVLKERDNLQSYGFMIHITEGEKAGLHSAYAMELLAAAGASAVRHLLQHARPGNPIHIYSDSLSAVQQLHASSRSLIRKLAHKRYGLLHTSLFRTRHHNVSTVHHLFSHPERRKRRENFTSLDLGNFLADSASSLDAPTRLFPGFARYTITARQLLENLLFPGQWFLGDSLGTPALDPPTSGIA
jgi:ribonuclease HI